ncbi:MAG: hypothetical protein ACYCT7_10640 [bacterium]
MSFGSLSEFDGAGIPLSVLTVPGILGAVGITGVGMLHGNK